MPGAGLEPARSCLRGILSPLCLPIPPPGPRNPSNRHNRLGATDRRGTPDPACSAIAAASPLDGISSGKMEAGIGIEPTYTALQAQPLSSPFKPLGAGLLSQNARIAPRWTAFYNAFRTAGESGFRPPGSQPRESKRESHIRIGNAFVMRRSAVRVCVPAPKSKTYTPFFLVLSYRRVIVLFDVEELPALPRNVPLCVVVFDWSPQISRMQLC